jgi:arylformamidase
MPIEEGMMVYKNKAEKQPIFHVRATHQQNGHYESSISLDLHTGTHVDMPLHMIASGHSSTQFDVTRINGKCQVLDFSNEVQEAIDGQWLSQFEFETDQIVLLKTKNSFDTHFNSAYVYLNENGAAFLKSKGIKAVGIDALGIERSAPGHPTHHVLLGNGIYIIEGLALAEVPQGYYTLHALPMKIQGVEGLPLRAYLEK